MKRIDYDSFRREKAPEALRLRAVHLNRQSRRIPRQRPRAPEEDELIGQLIMVRRDRLARSGELVREGLRRWCWRFPEFE